MEVVAKQAFECRGIDKVQCIQGTKRAVGRMGKGSMKNLVERLDDWS
jgi:hypothetical protein